MFPRLFSVSVLAASLAACTTPQEPAEPSGPIGVLPGEDAPCVADDAQRFVGQTATAAIGEQIVSATKAQIFQWVPPNSAVTMDYRPNRVRVSYDSDMKITSVRCG